MVFLNDEREKIIKGFKELAFVADELHKEIVEKAKLRIDHNDDIEAIMPNGKRYWIVTTPLIHLWNKNSRYEISFRYEIKADSKYESTIYSFTRFFVFIELTTCHRKHQLKKD